MKRLITGGVRNTNNNDYVIDYTYNLPEDIIEIVPPQLYKVEYGNYIYWFGYEFREGVGSHTRTQFINYLKGVGNNKIPENELLRFIELPLGELHKQINLYTIDCIVYPLSGRSNLVRTMVQDLNRWTSHDTHRLSFELVKSIPSLIEFDWESFEADYGDDPYRYSQMSDYVKNELLPKIHNLDYFSLAHSVKPKYRRYIKNFLNLDEIQANRLASLKGNNILIVDDINTSGATIDEILRIISLINNSCNIYIYTLIGHR